MIFIQALQERILSCDLIFFAFCAVSIPFSFIIFSPKSRFTRRVVFGFAATCGLIYGVVLLIQQPNLLKVIFFSYSSTVGFKHFLDDKWTLLATYLQIIAWDSVIGYFVSLECIQLQFTNRFRILILLPFMFFPPALFSLFNVLKFLKSKRSGSGKFQ